MSTDSAAPSRKPTSLKRLLHSAIGRFDRWYFNRFQLRNRSINGRLDSFLRAAARVYAHHELPGHIQILEALLVNRPPLWKDAGSVTCRGSWHGYTLRLDLTDFYQRWSYFLSRYHEVPLQLVLWRALQPGDTFIDGGANNGLVSMVAAWRVGPRGRVVSFEPNPVVFEQLQWHITTNKLARVKLIRAGLSDEPRELTLRTPTNGNLGAGSFAPLPPRQHLTPPTEVTALLSRGDDCAALADAPGEFVIKLDVEGFECRALDGLQNTIAKHKPLIITEANQEMLTQAGTSLQQMRDRLEPRGYQGHAMRSARAFIRHRRVVLTPITDWSHPPQDIVWILPSTPHAQRLSASMQP